MMKLKFLTLPFLMVGLVTNAMVAMETEEPDLTNLISSLPYPMIEQMDGPTKRVFRETCILACTEVENFCKIWNHNHKINLGWEFLLNQTLLYHLNQYVIGQVYFSNFTLNLSKYDNTILLLVINGSVDPAQEIVQIQKIGLQPYCNYSGFLGEEGTLDFDIEELTLDTLIAAQPKILPKIGCTLIDQNLDANGRLLCTASFEKYKRAENSVELWRHYALTPADKAIFFQKIERLKNIPHLASNDQMRDIFGKIVRIQEIEQQLPGVEAEHNATWQELLTLDPYMTPAKIRDAMYCCNNIFAKENPKIDRVDEIFKIFSGNIYNISKRLVDLAKDGALKEDVLWHFNSLRNLLWHFNSLGDVRKLHEEEAFEMAVLLMDKFQAPLESLKDFDIYNLIDTFTHHKSVESQKKIKKIEEFLRREKKHDYLLNLYLKMKMDQEAIALYKRNRESFWDNDAQEAGNVKYNIPSMLSEVAMSCLFQSDTSEALSIWKKIQSNAQPSFSEIFLAIAIHLIQGNKDGVWEDLKAYDERKVQSKEEEDDKAPNHIHEALVSLFKGDKEGAVKILEGSPDQMSKFSLIYLKEKMDCNTVMLHRDYSQEYGLFEDSKPQFTAFITFIDLILEFEQKKDLANTHDSV